MSNSINGRQPFISASNAGVDPFSTPVARKGDAAALPKPEQAAAESELKAPKSSQADSVQIAQLASFTTSPAGVARVQQQGHPGFDQMYQEWRKKTPGASDKPIATDAGEEQAEGFWSALQAGWKRVQR
jgi:hypothetical protein